MGEADPGRRNSKPRCSEGAAGDRKREKRFFKKYTEVGGVLTFQRSKDGGGTPFRINSRQTNKPKKVCRYGPGPGTEGGGYPMGKSEGTNGTPAWGRKKRKRKRLRKSAFGGNQMEKRKKPTTVIK